MVQSLPADASKKLLQFRCQPRDPFCTIQIGVLGTQDVGVHVVLSQENRVSWQGIAGQLLRGSLALGSPVGGGA